MTTNWDTYDPDNPPEDVARDFIGRLERSFYVENSVQADQHGVGDTYRQYIGKGGLADGTPVWFLEAVAVDLVYEDGSPVVRSDIIKLVDSQGRPLPKGQTPHQVAEAFLRLGVSASPKAQGSPHSAIGRVFRFRETELKLGRRGDFTKRIRLYPVELVTDSSQFTPKVIPLPGTSRTIEEPPEAGEEDIETLLQVLDGRPVTDVMTALLNAPELARIPRVMGMDIYQGAADGTLVQALVQAGKLVVQDGVLRRAVPGPVATN